MKLPRIALSLLVCAAALPLRAAQSQQPGVHVGAGADLQAALDAAKPGDTLLLDPGAEFVGNFVLPARPDRGTNVISLRTAGTRLPAAGERTTPSYLPALAMIRSPNAGPALSTARGTHHWRIENVAFGASRPGVNEIIALGSGDRAQRSAGDVPHDLVLDRVLVLGDPQLGQKRGVALNSASTEIVNSYFRDIKAAGADGQAIGGWNGPGPFLIENNYLEAAGENIMFGGADPSVDGLVPADITIRWNRISRPPGWRDAIVAAPSQVSITPCTAGCAGEGPGGGPFSYAVVAERPVAGDTAFSAPSQSVDGATARGPVVIEWSGVPGAAAYRVYRHGAAGDTYWRVTATRFVDTGAAGTAQAPTKRGTVWSVKNLLELKNARNVVIDGNLFEYHWPQAQAGYSILFTPRNQDGRAPWSGVQNVRFTNNVVRRVSGGINISGADDDHPSARTTGIVIENNLFLDVGGTWGAPGDFVQIGNGPADVRIEHNTVLETGRALVVYGSRHGSETPGFVFRGNLINHNRYGMFGEDVGTGKPAIAKYFPGGVVEGNTFAGGDAAEYPRGNRFVAPDAIDKLFGNAAGPLQLKRDLTFGDAGVDMDRLTMGERPRTTAPTSTVTPRQNKD